MANVNLPHPDIDFVPLDILTAAEQNQLVANINALAEFSNGLASGTNLSDDIVQSRSLTPAARGDYALNEVDTGQKWIDGKNIYKRTYNCGSPAGTTRREISHGLTGATIVGMEAVAIMTSGDLFPVPAPKDITGAIAGGTGVAIRATNTQIQFAASSTALNASTVYVTLHYTKS